jgi:hypothetical protein
MSIIEKGARSPRSQLNRLLAPSQVKGERACVKKDSFAKAFREDFSD